MTDEQICAALAAVSKRPGKPNWLQVAWDSPMSGQQPLLRLIAELHVEAARLRKERDAARAQVATLVAERDCLVVQNTALHVELQEYVDDSHPEDADRALCVPQRPPKPLPRPASPIADRLFAEARREALEEAARVVEQGCETDTGHVAPILAARIRAL
jgi:hypothetical protein